MKISESLAIYIFSYNRPEYLENCLLSIIRHAHEFDVTVCDDDSTDPAVDTVIDQFNERVRVMKPSQVRDHSDSVKHGGLYRNMTWALQDAETRGFNYALFIQDDQQLVRDFGYDDVEKVGAFFDDNPTSVELHTCFLKGRSKDMHENVYQVDVSGNAFMHKNLEVPFGVELSDIGIFQVERTRKLFPQFAPDEFENSQIARINGIRMGFFRYPFMHWLPFPKSFRGRKRKVFHSLIEWLGGSGFYPIDSMKKTDVVKLMVASEKDFPVAEEYLISERAPSNEFWGGGGLSNINARGGWRRWLILYCGKSYKRIRNVYSRDTSLVD